jgi:hypothetical protein
MSRARSTYDVDPGRGWILFAGTMLSLVGCLNAIYGIAAIANSSFFVGQMRYVFGDLNTWGWVLTVIGFAQIAISFGIFMTAEWARWAGIIVAALNMIVQFVAISSHPLISVLAFFVDVIVIWGLLTYGGKDRYSLAG